MNQFIDSTQTFGRGETTLPTPPPPQNVAKCGFWCKGFKILKVVVAIVAPPVAVALQVADTTLGLSDKIEAIDDKNSIDAQRSNIIYVQPSQQVRQGKLNIM